MRTCFGPLSVLVAAGLFWGPMVAAQTEEPVYKDRDRAVYAVYEDGVTRVGVFMAVYSWESVGYEASWADVYKLDHTTGELISCMTDQNVTVAVTPSGHASGRVSCAPLDAPIVITCNPSEATGTWFGSNDLKFRGPGDLASPKKQQSKYWDLHPLACSIVAFGAEYETSEAGASFTQGVVLP